MIHPQPGAADKSVASHTLRSRSALLRWLATQSDSDSSGAFRASVGVAAVVVVVLHWGQAAGLGSGSSVFAALPVGAAVILAVGCWALLLWLFWQTRLDPREPGYVLAVVLSVVAICIGLEAFAGLSTLLWERGMIRSATPGAPSLWRAEGHYLWQLLNSVPLVSAPQTVGWRDPQPFADHISGVLLLVFKIAIIAPLIRLGLSGYQFFEDRRVRVIAEKDRKAQARLKAQLESGEKPKPLYSYRPLLWQPRARAVWGLFTGLMVALICAAFVMVVLFDPGSWVNRWLSRHLRPGIHIGNFYLPPGWLHTAPQWLVVAALVAATRYAISTLSHTSAAPDKVRSIPVAVGAIFVYLWLLALLTLTFAAASLALLHAGVAIVHPEIPPGSQPHETLNAYAWAIADALPGPKIPPTLNWSLQYQFVDHWSEALLLLYKVTFVTILLFPLYRIIRVYAARSRPATVVEPSLPAARQFFDRLLAARAALDYLEKGGWTAYSTAEHALDDLESAVDKMQSLFGDGDVTRSANAAEAAAHNRHAAIASQATRNRGAAYASQVALNRRAMFSPLVAVPNRLTAFTSRSSGSSTAPVDLAGHRSTLNLRIAEFSRTANEALRDAALPHSSSSTNVADEWASTGTAILPRKKGGSKKGRQHTAGA
jgi:hypothetical protein